MQDVDQKIAEQILAFESAGKNGPETGLTEADDDDMTVSPPMVKAYSLDTHMRFENLPGD